MNDSSDNRLIQAYHRVIVVMMQHICSWIIFSDNMKMNRLVSGNQAIEVSWICFCNNLSLSF